mgnify:CR=1 FL=1
MNVSLTKYRQQLMGIAAIGVLLVHSTQIIALPTFLSKIFSYGGIGVYIFVFLSAIGLYMSLSRRGGIYSKKEFYKRRFTRALLPYLLIAVTWYGVKYLIFDHNIGAFFYETSLLSFWLEHRGAWYIAMLVPVYLIFPWFYDWIENSCSQSNYTRRMKIIAVGVVSSIVTFTISILDSQLYNHLSQIFSSVIVYMVGYYCAGKVMAGKYNGCFISVICLAFYIVKAITPLKNYNFVNSISWSLLAIPIITVSAWLLSKIKLRFIDAVLGFFGKYSLEMYLWNIFLIQATRYFGVIGWLEKHGDTSGYVAYGLVVADGIILSIVYRKLSDAIVQKMNMKKAN